MPAPTRQCLSTCAPGGPGLPTGSAATSPRVKTVCSSPKEPSANSPQGIRCRGQSLGPSLSRGHWIRLPKDCELGLELGIFRGVHGCVQGICTHIQPKGSILALREPGAVGQVPDEVSLQLTCSHLAGVHRGHWTVALGGGLLLFTLTQHAEGLLSTGPAPTTAPLFPEQGPAADRLPLPLPHNHQLDCTLPLGSDPPQPNTSICIPVGWKSIFSSPGPKINWRCFPQGRRQSMRQRIGD